MSIQTFTRAAPPSAPSAARRLLLDVALVPEREREQAPQLAAVVLAPRDVVVEEARRPPPAGRSPAARACRRTASRARTARARRAARPRRGSRSRACARARPRAAASGSAALRSSTFFDEAAHALLAREREREVRHDRVEERDARLERVRHRRAVGLHEQVVDEVDAEVDVLQARERLGALGLARSARGRRRPGRTRCVAPGELGARGRREDLLPAVVALERRQVRGADEALRPVVEARPPARARQPLDERRRQPRERADAVGEQVGRVRVVAAEELVAALAGERDLHVLGGELRDEVRRQRRRVGERLVERVARARAAAARGSGWRSSS